MKVKVIAAIVIIAVVIPPLYLGGWALQVLLWVVAAGAAYESAMLVAKKRDILGTVLNLAAILAMFYVPETYYAAAVSIWLVVLFTIEILKGKVATDNVVYPFAITVLTGLALRCVGRIYNNPDWTGWLVMLYVALACYLCDTGAYFFGVAFGKHKMIPEVSPHKTWEGSIGGYLSGLAGSLLLGLLCLKQLPSSLIIAGSLILPAVAQIGDLSFSSIKRRFGIKDFSNLIPGHGGILDRVDSIIFCLMMFNALLIIWGIA